ncbi:glycoside hydrolase family 88 protein [Paenibacillus qinlingensis]|uniref:glycoside hydrolase family 88 protein n=1 Tax=Paenibacillus qinlingensis TaxID=1837343 RepID=UPI001565238C|nr:glycoside hydrolase family 88 protein [Paenibacillus qinlingensis]NQX60133.1 glycoside hydrolase family 88 protein [Paenibacillus qinlingensis]
MTFKYHLAEIIQAVQIDVPENKRIPFNWQAVGVGGSQSLTVRMGWTDKAVPVLLGAESVQLRITAALDVRETILLEAVTAKSHRQVGIFDIRYASTLQPFEIQLIPDDWEAVIEEGIELRMQEGSLPFWILVPDSALCDQASLLFPHLLISDSESAQQSARDQPLLHTLSSLSSLQPFGWLEGCVLDGLMDLSQALGEPRFEDAARAHLALYLDENNNLKYEDPLSEPSDGKVYGIEGTLPFAAWARLQPDHPVMEQAISLWMSHIREDGAICGTGMLSAEGSYTVAYPMAVLARVRQDVGLAEMAVRQLEVRRQLLTKSEGDLYLRCYTNGSLTFRHWARAHAWYLLGLIRTLMELREAGHSSVGADRCASEFVRAANVALSYQSTDGLWSVFLDEPSTGSDTSGSAGIAAALALGANFGLLPEHARLAAERALEALLSFLTPDGILRHVAQSNKGGEALQRSGYRVMFQMATGLLGQLYAALQR